MKVANKALFIIGLTWFPIIAFVASLFIISRSHQINSLPLVFLISIFLAALSYVMFYLFLIKPIKNFHQEINQLETDKSFLMNRMKMTDKKNEFDEMRMHVNNILDYFSGMQNQLQKNLALRTEDLDKANINLKKSILIQTEIEKRLANYDAHLTKIAHYDSLTELPNQVLFNEILNKAIYHAKRHKKILGVLLIDLSSFTKKNLFTLEENEIFIKEMNQRLQKILRTEDILAKYDNDTFIILLNDIKKPKYAGVVSEKILHACYKPVVIDHQEFKLTAHIGIAVYPHDGTSLEEILNHADYALYKAKQTNIVNNYQFFTHEIDIEAREYIQLESALRKAIHNNELAIYYQPIYHLKRGSISSVEALIRWEHPALGIIYPDKFLPLAEETGLIMQIGEWILRKACQTNKQWQNEGYEHLTVSVNLSPKQFHHPEIVNTIINVLKDSKLNPKYLLLEITEKTIMDDVVAASDILNNIKRTGVQLSIDHFGIGYTSISGLKQFPISILKIDPSFIKGIPNNPNDLAIISAFISLAHNLGLEVIAEGIETSEQVQYLASQYCDMVQGYFLGHPLPAQKVIQQFKKLTEKALV